MNGFVTSVRARIISSVNDYADNLRNVRTIERGAGAAPGKEEW